MLRSGDGGGRIAAALVSHSFAADDPTGMPAIYASGYGIGSFECSANHDYVGEDADEACRAFVLRRLQAVPNVSIFHEGGPLSWDIEFGHANGEGVSRVKIRGVAKPLPILGAFVRAFAAGESQGNVAIEVEVLYASRPEWLEGDYETWNSSWGA